VHHLLLAAEAVKPSKTPFYIAGGLLAAWAVLIALFGISRHRDWPASEGVARGIMLVSVVLVAAAMATAVITS
jgi:hypothetical protein